MRKNPTKKIWAGRDAPRHAARGGMLCCSMLVCGLLFSANSVSAPTYLTNYTVYNGHTYAITNPGSTWTEADAFATSQGGYLAAIGDSAENSFLYDNLVSLDNQDYWIGLSCASGPCNSPPTNWQWSNGESVVFTNFRASQPDGSAPSYAVMNYNGTGPAWDDYWDTFRRPRAIVEFDSVVPVPAAVWLFGSGLLGLIGVTRRRKGA